MRLSNILKVGGRIVAVCAAVVVMAQPVLAQRGLMLVGLDVIGGHLTEINVTSPTCFQEISDQTGCDVPALFIDALERV